MLPTKESINAWKFVNNKTLQYNNNRPGVEGNLLYSHQWRFIIRKRTQ